MSVPVARRGGRCRGARAISLLLLAPGLAQAAVVLVPGQQPTIQAGIDAASPGDTVLVANGTYTGAGNRNIGFGGRAIVVRSQGGAAVCTVDAGSAGRGFVFAAGETPSARLEGFTITRGTHASAGGGVYVAASSPTIVDCIIVDNRTESGTPGTSGVPGGAGGSGGGVHVASGSPSFERCTIRANRTGSGGAGFVSGSGPGGSAGGSAGAGAGVFVATGASARLERCIIADNVTGAGGQGGSSVICVPPLACQTFGENGGNGGDGGGVHTDSVLLAVNCLFLANRTGAGGAAGAGSGLPLPSPGRGGNGGGWSGGDAASVLVNCTLVDNLVASAGPAGQPPGNGGGIAGMPTVANAIVWGNLAPPFSGLPAVTYSDVEGGFPGLGNIAADPMFSDAAGGDHRLRAGSPCVDAGSGPAVPAGVTTDLDGNDRFVDGDLDSSVIVDMGAYELDPLTSGIQEGGDRSGTTALGIPIDPADGGPIVFPYRIAPVGAEARLDLYDAQGRHLRCLAQGWHPAGEHIRTWDRRTGSGERLARGVYFVRLHTATEQDSRRVLLLRP